MKSSKLEVRFDSKTHEPTGLVNVQTGDRLVLTPESAFRLEFYKIGTTITDLAQAIGEKKAQLFAVDARECRTVNESGS